MKNRCSLQIVADSTSKTTRPADKTPTSSPNMDVEQKKARFYTQATRIPQHARLRKLPESRKQPESPKLPESPNMP